MAKLNEVIGGLATALHIFNHHRVHEFARVLIVYQHDGNSHFRKQWNV